MLFFIAESLIEVIEINMLIAESEKRQEASKKNRQTVLRFLLCHKYSTLKNVAFELGHKSTASASRILKKLCSDGLVKKEVIKEEFTKVTLFGITKFGVGALGEDVDEVRHFMPSRVSLRNLTHTLVNQRVGTWMRNLIKANNFNSIKVINSEFGNLKKYNHIVNFKHRPDLLIVAKKNDHVYIYLIETELSLKDSKRYKKIWNEYIQLKRKECIQSVFYFVSNSSAENRIEEMKKKLSFHLISGLDNKNLLENTIKTVNIEEKDGING